MLNKGQASSALQDKSQLLQGSGKRLPYPSQRRGVFQRFLLCLSVTHQVQIVGAEVERHSAQRSDLVWPLTHGCLLQPHAGMMHQGENSLVSISKAALQNPELKYKSSSSSHGLCSYGSFSTVRERWIWKLLFPWGEGGNKQKKEEGELK